MANNLYKKYTKQAKSGIKGESFFESLVSDFSIPHRISGLKDVGLDYICEWAFGDKPSGVLFGVQVKTLIDKRIKPKSFGISDLNGLEQHKIGSSKLKIDESTLTYWKGFGIPVYLFAIILERGDEEDLLNCHYKRFSPILTSKATQNSEHFYKVNGSNNSFLAFSNPQTRILGFARDLFIDYTRWNYYKGSITYLNPRHLGLMQFPEEGVFKDLFSEYETQIHSTYQKTTLYLQRIHDNNET